MATSARLSTPCGTMPKYCGWSARNGICGVIIRPSINSMRTNWKKYQSGISYDYDKAVKRCIKKRERAQRDSDVDGEAMMMACLKSRQATQIRGTEDEKNPGDRPPEQIENVLEMDSAWTEDVQGGGDESANIPLHAIKSESGVFEI